MINIQFMRENLFDNKVFFYFIHVYIQEWETRTKILVTETLRKSRFHITYTKSLIEFQFIFTSIIINFFSLSDSFLYLVSCEKQGHQ